MRLPIAIMIVGLTCEPSLVAQSECTFVGFLTALSEAPPSSRNISSTAAMRRWERGLHTEQLEAEWRRLYAEGRDAVSGAKTDDARWKAEFGTGELRSIFFEHACRARNKNFATFLLADGAIAFVRPRIRPEWFLVDNLGVSGFECVFDAYANAGDRRDVQEWLCQRVKTSFGLLLNDVWQLDDPEKTVMAKLKAWFVAHSKNLRLVEVYDLQGEREHFSSQGILEGEKLIGLFFWRPTK